MALYDYRCKNSDCKETIEVRHPIGELGKVIVKCEKCGGEMAPLITVSAKPVWKCPSG